VGAVLEDVPRGAGAEHGLDELRVLVHGESEDLGPGERGDDLTRSLDAAQARHGDVDEDGVGPELPDKPDHCPTVVGLAQDADAGFCIQEAPKALAIGLVVVC
jgi:hypothetical protein